MSPFIGRQIYCRLNLYFIIFGIYIYKFPFLIIISIVSMPDKETCIYTEQRADPVPYPLTGFTCFGYKLFIMFHKHFHRNGSAELHDIRPGPRGGTCIVVFHISDISFLNRFLAAAFLCLAFLGDGDCGRIGIRIRDGHCGLAGFLYFIRGI